MQQLPKQTKPTEKQAQVSATNLVLISLAIASLKKAYINP